MNFELQVLIIGGSQVGKYSLACSFSKFKNLKGYAELISFVSNVISFDHVQITGHVFMDVCIMGQHFGALDYHKSQRMESFMCWMCHKLVKAIEKNFTSGIYLF